MRKRLLFATVLALKTVGSSAFARPEDGRLGILQAFRTHPIVLLGEVHRSAEMHAFLRSLIATPEFPQVVDDIVVEAVNVRYQPLLDRFAAGDSVPRDSLRLAWRNSTQLLLWDSPLYEELLDTVRDVNRTLPTGRKLRLLASDPPIDWAQVRSANDFPRTFGYRDWQTTEVIEREVLARRRHALVIIGTAHIRRAGPALDSLPIPPEREGVGEALGRKNPGAAWVVETVVGDGNPEMVDLVAGLTRPGTLLPVAATPLAARSSAVLFGNVVRFRIVDGHRVPISIPTDQVPPLGRVIDAVLYLGPYSHEVLPTPEFYLRDAPYLTEVRRRIGILTQVYGGDFWTSDLEALLRCAQP